MINADALIAGDYSIEISRVSGDTDYILEVSPKTNTDPLTGQPLAPSSNSPFESGVFKVGPTGKVDLSYLFDGGFYEGDVGIFKLEGMPAFLNDYSAFAKEAARRALSNSSEGHTVISDFTEGAKLTGILGAEPQNWNKGTYQGVKTVSMNPGDEFGIILAPRNRIQDVFNNPALTGTRRPLFSLATADPRDAFNSGQIADVTGKGYAFAFEDMQVNAGADKDYNDVMFQIAGATGKAPSINNVIAPSLDWRGTVLGEEILDEINSADTEPPEIAAYLANDTGEDTADGITSDPAISGTAIDVSGIFSLRAGFEGMPVESFTEIASRLNEDGTFSLDRNALEEIFGGALPEGSHTLYLRAIDENGNVSEFEGIRFTLVPATNDSGSLDSEVQFSVELAQLYGLDPYPDAISLPVGGTRQLSVKVNGLSNSSNLNTDESGTRYSVSDPSVLSVSEDGLVTALKSGDATVTVRNGSAVEVIPIRVENPQLGPATLGAPGGVVRASDGSMVMVAPGALEEDTTVSLTPLSRENLSLPIPEGLGFAGAFNLDAGDDPMKVPAQLAIPAPAGLPEGTQVFFMREGALPDAQGTWNPTWLIEETGVVSGGTIRTSSPPWNGVNTSGRWVINYFVPGYNPTGFNPFAPSSAAADAISIATDLSLQTTHLAARLGFIGIIAATTTQFVATALLLAYLAKYLQSDSVEVIAIPKVGLPVVNTAGVELNPEGIPSFKAVLNAPAQEADPLAPPALQEAELRFENSEPVVFLRGSNFLNDFGGVGSNFTDLTAKFYVGNRVYEGEVLPESGKELESNQYEVAVKVPYTVPLGESRIVLSRQQKEQLGPGQQDYEIVELDSEEEIRLAPNCVDLALVAQQSEDVISVINGKQLGTAGKTSDLLTARIPVGTADRQDGPAELAAVASATRAYVPLEQSGRVAVADLMALRQVDSNPETPDVEPIDLPAGAKPRTIAIDPSEEFAYIADGASGSIYVLDIDPFSETYHQVVHRILVSPVPSGLRQIAISSDGRRLFATALSGYIFVINIDPNDRPTDLNQNSRKWREQIGAISMLSGTEGIAPTSNPLQMAFTNRLRDNQGFGVLEITNDDPLNFAATTRYAALSLDTAQDYFDVNRAVAVTVTRDGRYAFVAGINDSPQTNVESVDGPRAGSNIGIIKDPLGPAPQLIAATRPIPKGLTTDLVLSSDDKYLTVSYPGLQLQSSSPDQKGSTFIYDVDEIIKAVENPGNYWLDSYSRGTGSVAFDETSKRAATARDLLFVPVDDINPDISVAADYEIIGGNWVNQFTFGVPQDSNRAPIGMVSPKGLTVASARDWVDLLSPGAGGSTDDLTPTFEWKFKDDSESCGIPNLSPQDISEVNLYVSVFPKGQGLLPEDRWQGLGNVTPGRDYNPNRVLTATWKEGKWTWNGGSTSGDLNNGLKDDSNKDFSKFTLPDERILTAGQTYHWAVEAVIKGEKQNPVADKFKTLLPQPAAGSNTFSSVTVLTRGVEPGDNAHSQFIDGQLDAMARHIQEAGGSVMNYNQTTGKWQSVIYQGNTWVPSSNQLPQYGKPLVLLADWMEGIQPSSLYNAGFAEGAADALFAALVQLDQERGGKVGEGGHLYNETGQLIRTQGAVLNSPLHFIGFGQGAVVNSEIIQRLGTFFPNAGGTSNESRDLQMTTVDPHDYDLNFPKEVFRNILDPEVKVWKNVTYADNYYQDKGTGNTLNGKALSEANWKADWNVNLGNWTGFDQNLDTGSPHRASAAWYAGTTNLSDSENIYRRLGDLELNTSGQPIKPAWYTPDHTRASFEHSSENAPWEGIGTGWFNSVNGGSSDQRPYYVNGSKKSKEQLGNFEDYLKNNRVSVSVDNTPSARMQGDYAVPTLFNGNFDALSVNKGKLQSIPGWSFLHKTDQTAQTGSISQGQLIEWKKIASQKESPIFASHLGKLGIKSSSPNYSPNYALKLQPGQTITHNPFIVPDWGVLRLDLHVPKSALNQEGQLNIYLEELGTPDNSSQGKISLEEAKVNTKPVTRTRLDGSTYPVRVPGSYEDDKNRIGYASSGFETFHIDVDPKLRGKVAKLTLELQSGAPVYIDNVFFKSDALKWGNPTEARNDPHYGNNFLIEKPQYTLSYNQEKNTINWVAWKLDKTWLGEAKRKKDFGFAEDPSLKNPDWYSVQDIDYDALYLKDRNGQAVANQTYESMFITDRGHMAPAADRTRSIKDLHATFLTSNLLPQQSSNNRGIWEQLEYDMREVVKDRLSRYSSIETYFIAGGYDVNPQYTGISRNQSLKPLIHLPLGLWKVVLTSANHSPLPTAAHFGVFMGNQPRTSWDNFTLKIQDLQNILNSDSQASSPKYNFLTNLAASQVEALKNGQKIISPS